MVLYGSTETFYEKGNICDFVSKGLPIGSGEDDQTAAVKIRMAEIREFYGVPKTAFVHMLGTTYRQYIRFEQGKSAVPCWVIAALSFYYNLSGDFILELTDEPFPLYDGDYQSLNGQCLGDILDRE